MANNLEVRHTEIHDAIAAVYAKTGYVQKQSKPSLGYSYAGEAALIAAIRPELVNNGIYVSVVDVSDVEHETYQTKNNTMNRVTLKAVIRFTHAPSQSYIDVVALGEGADVGDKATNKALTGAYKYALRQTFCIETGDDPDGESSEHQERAPRYEGREVPPDIERNFNMNDYEPVGVQRGKNGRPNWDAFWAWANELGLTSQQLGSYIGKPDMKGSTQVELDRVRQLVTQEMDHDYRFRRTK